MDWWESLERHTDNENTGAIVNIISEIMGHLEIPSKLDKKEAMGKKEDSWGQTQPNIKKI